MAKTTILIVEDEAIVAADLASKLEQLGYQVAGIAARGGQAVDLAHALRPGLVLMDIHLAGPMDGVDAAERIRRECDLPVIYLTAHLDPATLQRAKLTEPFGYILKPFDERELETCVEIALYKHQAEGKLRDAYDKMEARVQERTIDLLQSNLALEVEIKRSSEANQQLTAANQELAAFAYTIAHHLRAPLRAMNGFAGMLLEDFGAQLPPEGRKFLTRIQDGGQHMGELIDGLLAYTHLGRQPVDRQEVDMARLVREVCENLQPAANLRQLQLQVGRLPPCYGDPVLLKQAWLHLVSNAAKFTRDRQPALVEIGCEQTEGSAVYFVRDNGVGFDMRYANKLFLVFERLHGLDEFPGIGLGLAMVRRIVQRHGGRAWANAQPDRGATFYFTLDGEKT